MKIESQKYALLKNRGELCPTFWEFFNRPQFKKYGEKYVMSSGLTYKELEMPEYNAKVEVLGGDGELCVIQPVNSDKIYLIYNTGLEFL